LPSFFRHEGEMLARLDPAVVPPLIAADEARVLLDEVPGDDLYEASLPLLLVMVRLLVDLQTQWSTRLRALDDIALPDWRIEAFIALADDVATRTAVQLDAATRSGLERLVDELPARFAAVTACGIPDSLVHGDFHPGNIRGDADRIVLLDWGDCGIGHPLLDQAAFIARIAPAARRPVAEEWTRLWRKAVPSSDPRHASKLLAPVAALRQAIVYRRFLDAIEPSEQVYHRGDPARWLIRAVELTRAEDRSRSASRP
jgi:Ser/Thr protein kinase RdoA (MazF antagonist)